MRARVRVRARACADWVVLAVVARGCESGCMGACGALHESLFVELYIWNLDLRHKTEVRTHMVERIIIGRPASVSVFSRVAT